MMIVYKKLIKYVSFILILIGLYIGLCYKFPNLSFLKNKPINIQDTKLVVEESKKIAQLFSAKYYAEIVIDSVRFIKKDRIDIQNSILSLSSKHYKDSIKEEIVIIASGNCYAGNDLSKTEILKDDKKNTCHLIIPNAEVFNTVINPSDFNIFYEKGEWSKEDIQKVKSHGIDKIKKFALENGIIEKANNRTFKLLKDFLNTLGYENIKIEFKQKTQC